MMKYKIIPKEKDVAKYIDKRDEADETLERWGLEAKEWYDLG